LYPFKNHSRQLKFLSFSSLPAIVPTEAS